MSRMPTSQYSPASLWLQIVQSVLEAQQDPTERGSGQGVLYSSHTSWPSVSLGRDGGIDGREESDWYFLNTFWI